MMPKSAKKAGKQLEKWFQDFDEMLVKPSSESSQMKRNAVLRFWGHGFVEYDRKRLEQVVSALKSRIWCASAGLDVLTETDKFVFFMLRQFTGIK